MCLRFLFAAFLMLAAVIPASAQTTGGVFGPDVKAGASGFQYRFAWAAGDGSAPDRYAHRLHWDQSLDGRRSLRLIASATGPSGDLEFATTEAQLLLELTPDTAHDWTSALRFDLSAGFNGRANSAGIGWTNEFDLGGGWTTRAIAMTAVEFGDHARDGLFLQSRFRINKRLEGGQGIGVELFDSYSSTDALGRFDDQNHRAGPYLTLPLHDGWSLFAGTLFGLSDRAADEEIRFWAGRSF